MRKHWETTVECASCKEKATVQDIGSLPAGWLGLSVPAWVVTCPARRDIEASELGEPGRTLEPLCSRECIMKYVTERHEEWPYNTAVGPTD